MLFDDGGQSWQSVDATLWPDELVQAPTTMAANLEEFTWRQLGPNSLACSHDKAYVSILITVIPLGLMLTLLIIFGLMAFHKSIRSTKIYDNCTSQSANYVYHIEIRTGDTSATYTRRKATLTIDMFDENQMTLARIAVPGHVIFGRKESPIDSVDDERFAELRVARLWLYRATRLRRVATIRLTHTCAEPEARIMIYGIELRTDDEDRPRLFFPVMNYITAYGAQNRPNACFDPDPLGTISSMGQYPDSATVSDHLTHLDYTVLVFVFCALALYLSTHEILPEAFRENPQAVYKGAILGCICFGASFVAGIFMRYVVKYYYSLNVGRGFWGVTYYTFTGLLLAVSFILWIFTTFIAYKVLCSNHFSTWLISICVAVMEATGFTIMCATIAWMLVTTTPIYAEQLVLPEEPGGGGGGGGGGVEMRGEIGNKTSGGSSGGRLQKSVRPIKSPSSDLLMMPTPEHGPPRSPRAMAQHQRAQAPSWQTMGSSTPPLIMGLQPLQQHPMAPNYQHSANLFGQPTQPGPYMMVQPLAPGAQNTYKVAPFTPPGGNYQPYPDSGQHAGYAQGAQSPYYGQGQNSPIAPPAGQTTTTPTATHTAATPPTVFHTMQLPRPPAPKHPAGAHHHHHNMPSGPYQTYGQQVGAATKQPSGRPKTGSNDSTGSTYYQQLMKNKGGVKSISQYGELMKKNKK